MLTATSGDMWLLAKKKKNWPKKWKTSTACSHWNRQADVSSIGATEGFATADVPS